MSKIIAAGAGALCTAGLLWLYQQAPFQLAVVPRDPPKAQSEAPKDQPAPRVIQAEPIGPPQQLQPPPQPQAALPPPAESVSKPAAPIKRKPKPRKKRAPTDAATAALRSQWSAGKKSQAPAAKPAISFSDLFR